MYQSNDQRAFARALRSNQTEAERQLWSRLRKRQLCDCRFRRQFAVGPFVVDFECSERQVVVELDGGGHNTEAERQRDQRRTQYLESRGYQVLRYWNTDVTDDTDAVLEAIARVLVDRVSGRPHPNPPPVGEGT
ncbi:endonuclease domain-containing protein [Posidoniimonas corsicana]|uniref:endonuclease domain-containing protein n=1 Tax=Posidoniimonas corsicana TaxID=1938618 RepID=UPI0011B676EF